MTKVWMPVADGIYQGFEVNAEGSEIVTTTNDVHGIEWDASIMLPTNIRLCELVEVDAPPTMPVSEIRLVAYALKAWWTFGSEASLPSQTEIRDLEIVEQWLDAQPKEGGSDE